MTPRPMIPAQAISPGVYAPTVLVLATGSTDQDRANNRGHLFEVFIARLLEVYGYEPPTVKALNVTSDGIELDVVTKHSLSRQAAIAECKAYRTNLPASALDIFYGKLAVARLRAPDTFGIFAALPGLTQPALEQVRAIQRDDPRFLLLTADDVVEKLREKHVLREAPASAQTILSDNAVIITEHGIFSGAKQVDQTTRLPEVVRVWGDEDIVPDPVIDLVGESDYAAGLGVRRFVDPLPISALGVVEEPRLVEVVGGQGDFDYQLPTAAKFFVGRHGLLGQLEGLLSPVTPRGRVLVLNAQSGWGKSSVAIRFKARVEATAGIAVVLDTRTAAGPDFVTVALRHAAIKAQAAGLLTLRDDASFAGLTSALETIAHSMWADPLRPLVLVFDQFEGVFQDERLTREFRDLALAVSELVAPLLVGFAWKTDLLGWTESHPYRLRDEIRDRAIVLTVAPLGPSEITILLSRLEKSVGARLLPELKQRLREYSQGLPWLFKKLSSHLLRELAAGKSQEALLSERLNVQALFESDLAQLGPGEQAALRSIARLAPVAVADALELSDPNVVQTLVHQRLVVQVGDRLDIYWDIFRDYLNTGQVPVQETYILRLTPAQVARLLNLAFGHGGDVTVGDAATALGTSEGVIFNAARDLRQMGVLVASPGHVRLADDLLAATEREEAVRERIAQALRRHRAFSLLSVEVESHGGELSIAGFAEVLPQAFPAVQAHPRTWSTYARAFVYWFAYARLISKVGDTIRSGTSSQASLKLLGTTRVTLRQRRSFPQSPPGPALRVLKTLAGITPLGDMKPGTILKAVGDLVLLGAISLSEDDRITLDVPNLLDSEGNLDGAILTALLARTPGGKEGLAVLDDDPGAESRVVGEAIAHGRGAHWRVSTATTVGKQFRAWVRLAQGRTPRIYRRRSGRPSQLSIGV